MSIIPDELHYTEEHEYVRITDEPTVVQIGITDYAQGELVKIFFCHGFTALNKDISLPENIKDSYLTG